MRKVAAWTLVALAIFGGLAALTLKFIFGVYRVPGVSMAPTVEQGDRIVVNKFAFRSGPPRSGDVILLRTPPEWKLDESDVVQRVIAVGGQTVECRAETGLTVNGERLQEPYLDAQIMQADPQVFPCLGPEFGPVAVPAGRLWVMGDNRSHSADSRAHCATVPAAGSNGVICNGDPMPGTIPIANVIGLVVFNERSFLQ